MKEEYMWYLKCISILEMIRDSEKPMTLEEIAEKSGLPKTVTGVIVRGYFDAQFLDYKNLRDYHGHTKKGYIYCG